MGRRGPRSKLTDEMIEKVKDQYKSGMAHRAIADELGISETNIRRIIGMHGIPKRQRKLATLLTPQEEDALVGFLSTLGPFRGKYRTLRNLMEQYAQENGMKCTFTYSWRDGFVRRHRHRLPSHIIKLLSPKVQREDDLDSDLDAVDSSSIRGDDGYAKEPSVWKQKPKLTTQQRAIKETTKAFIKAGLTKEDVHELLVKLKVPGVSEPQPAQVSSDVVAAALNNVFGETSSEPGTSTSVADPAMIAAATSAATAAVAAARKQGRKTPMKKNLYQLEILEKAFIRSQTCGDKRAKKLARMLNLTAAQVIYWFHNTARHKRKVVTQTIIYQEGMGGTMETIEQDQEEHQLEGIETEAEEMAIVEGELTEGEEGAEMLEQELKMATETEIEA